MHADPLAFKRCSTCRTPIDWGAKYFTCSVSTCNRPRIGLFFCSVACWDAHLPEARHRDAWAEEQRAPAAAPAEEASAAGAEEAGPRRRVVAAAAQAPSPEQAGADDGEEGEREVLVVVSKVKSYVRGRSEMNTSDRVAEVLSDHLRALLREAIREAARQDRKTILDRDVLAILRKG